MYIIVLYSSGWGNLCVYFFPGISLDTKRIDKVEEVVATAIAAGRSSILSYVFALCQNARNITPREFRLAVIDVLVRHYGTLTVPDYSNMCFGLQYLNKPEEVARILEQLLRVIS